MGSPASVRRKRGNMVVDRNTIADLYIQGTSFELTNPKDPDDPIKLFMKKLGPLTQQKALKKANAARLKENLVMKRDDDDEDKMDVYNDVLEIGERDEWITYLAEMEIAGERQFLEQELSQEDEWAEDDYLQGLLDSWDDEMQAEFDKGEGNRSEECQQIWDEMTRFNNILESKLKKRRNKAEAELEALDDNELFDKVAKSLSERNASIAWL